MTGLLAGSGLGVTLLEANLKGSPAFYTEYKQLVIRAYTLPLPVLAGGGILAALGVLFFGRPGPDDRLADIRHGPISRHRGWSSR